MIEKAAVTKDRSPVPAVVVIKAAHMKEAWCLATSHADLKPRDVVDLYGKRFTIEETFRDTKDIHYMLIPNMKEEDLVPLVTRFGEMVAEQQVCRDAFGLL